MRTLIILLISILSFDGYCQNKLDNVYRLNEEEFVISEYKKISEYNRDDFMDKSIPLLVEVSILNKMFEMPYLTPFLEPFIKIKDKIINIKPDKVKGNYIITPKPEVVSKSDNNKFAVILYDVLHFKVNIFKHPEGPLYEAKMYYIDNKNKTSKETAAMIRQMNIFEQDITSTSIYSSGMYSLYSYFAKEYSSGNLYFNDLKKKCKDY